MYNIYVYLIYESSRGEGAQVVTVKSTSCGFEWGLEEMKYLFKFIFPFLRSGVEDKRVVEFYHSILNASRLRQKVGQGVSQH